MTAKFPSPPENQNDSDKTVLEEAQRPEFQATKRIGRGLQSVPKRQGENVSLSWQQATRALKALESHLDEKLHGAHMSAVELLDHTVITTYSRRPVDADERQPHEHRGQVYHSRYIEIELFGFAILLSFTFTICVEILVPLAKSKNDITSIPSKFWYSAIIKCDQNDIDQPNFARVCEAIDDLAQKTLEGVRPVYLVALQYENSAIETINVNDDVLISDVLFQIDDKDFRDELDQIRSGRLSLDESRKSQSLKLLDGLFSGEQARSFLHHGRSDEESESVDIDSMIQQTSLCAQAFYIETRVRNQTQRIVERKSLGATSSREPVEPWSGDFSTIAALSHAPANVISAQRAAEMGEALR